MDCVSGTNAASVFQTTFTDIGSDLHITLPKAGTFRVEADITINAQANVDTYYFQWFNVTDSTTTGFKGNNFYAPTPANTAGFYTIHISNIMTNISGPKVITLIMENAAGVARGSTKNDISTIQYLGGL